MYYKFINFWELNCKGLIIIFRISSGNFFFREVLVYRGGKFHLGFIWLTSQSKLNGMGKYVCRNRQIRRYQSVERVPGRGPKSHSTGKQTV